MDKATHTAIEQDLYSDLTPRNFAEEKLFLAHYTTIEALEKIAHSGELWFSHPFLMNDHEEVAFGLSYGTKVVMEDAELKAALATSERQIAFLDSFFSQREQFPF